MLCVLRDPISHDYFNFLSYGTDQAKISQWSQSNLSTGPNVEINVESSNLIPKLSNGFSCQFSLRKICIAIVLFDDAIVWEDDLPLIQQTIRNVEKIKMFST